MIIIHKINDDFDDKDMLSNEDGTWKVVCKNKSSSSCKASKDWKFVNCKNCLNRRINKIRV